jgi:hypothetical protein
MTVFSVRRNGNNKNKFFGPFACLLRTYHEILFCKICTIVFVTEIARRWRFALKSRFFLSSVFYSFFFGESLELERGKKREFLLDKLFTSWQGMKTLYKI